MSNLLNLLLFIDHVEIASGGTLSHKLAALESVILIHPLQREALVLLLVLAQWSVIRRTLPHWFHMIQRQLSGTLGIVPQTGSGRELLVVGLQQHLNVVLSSVLLQTEHRILTGNAKCDVSTRIALIDRPLQMIQLWLGQSL
jgi:hypothetical protein